MNAISKTTKSATSGKPKWKPPYDDFPLSYHPPSNRLYKKIKGKRYYFGYASDPQAAVDKYSRERDDLQAGRTPRPVVEGVTVKDIANHFLNAKRRLLENGELSPRSFADYLRTANRIVMQFDKGRVAVDLRPDDFAKFRRTLSKTLGPTAIGNEIQRTRTIFKWAFDAEMLDRPVRYGPDFKKPSRRVMRQTRHANGERMFEAAEILAILDNASTQLKAMTLLGINCGFGQSDIGSLPISALDLKRGWITFPRPKTGVPRRIPLWPETIAALRDVLAKRKPPTDEADADIVFVTKYRKRWTRTTEIKELPKNGDAAKRRGPKAMREIVGGTPVDRVGEQFAKLLKDLGIKRARVSFYALRHTFETIGGESLDPVAVGAIMGHVDTTMAGHYRERISDERLKATVETVHRWLFPADGEGSEKE